MESVIAARTVAFSGGHKMNNDYSSLPGGSATRGNTALGEGACRAMLPHLGAAAEADAAGPSPPWNSRWWRPCRCGGWPGFWRRYRAAAAADIEAAAKTDAAAPDTTQVG